MLRSMTGMFSTIINFSMLNLLQRLHKIDILERLQSAAEKEKHKIVFPRQEKYGKGKEGDNKCSEFVPLKELTNEKILECLKAALIRAQRSVTDLGMKNDLITAKEWRDYVNEDSDDVRYNVENEDDEDEDDEEKDHSEEKDNDKYEENELDINERKKLAEGIEKLENIADKSALSKAKERLKKLSKVEDTKSITQYEAVGNTIPDHQSAFVEVKLEDGNTTFIRKSTAVWLFQEAERVSSDRLLRVRAKQAADNSENVIPTSSSSHSKEPIKSTYIRVGDICVFQQISTDDKSFRIGKVLQFIELCSQNKQKSYKGNHADVTSSCGVLCTWYINKECNTFEMLPNSVTTYYHINTYICTLTPSCIVNASQKKSNFGFIPSAPLVGRTLLIEEEAIQNIKSMFQEVEKEIVIKAKSEDSSDSSIWLKCGKISLTNKERSVIISGGKLSDQHMNAVQELIKLQFPDLNGLQQTFLQTKYPLKSRTNVIQILHIDTDHWAVMTMKDEADIDHVKYYDSAYSNISLETQNTMTQLLPPEFFKLHVSIMATAKQSGSTDCGLYAIAILTALAYSMDPSNLIFHQEDMRTHLVNCLKTKRMIPFPTMKTRRLKNIVIKNVTIYVCPTCKKLENDNSEQMLGCDRCDNWYHDSCITAQTDTVTGKNEDEWFCTNCI